MGKFKSNVSMCKGLIYNDLDCSALIKLGRRADNKEGKVTENDVLMGRIVVLLTEAFDLKKSVELERDSKDISTFCREQNPIINHCTEMVLPLLI